jgi:hypothetical protein
MGNCYGPQFTLNGIQTINQSQLQIYRKAWSDFDRIQLYNSNISTFNGSTGGKNSNYYMFVSYSEKNSFLNGQFLHQQQYPNSNWNTIQEN